MKTTIANLVCRIALVGLVSVMALLPPAVQASPQCIDDLGCANSCWLACQGILNSHEYQQCMGACQAQCTTCF